MKLDLTSLLARPRAPYLAIVALFLVVRIGFFVGYTNFDPWDDTTYIAVAEDLHTGAFHAKLAPLADWRGMPLPPSLLALFRPLYVLPLAFFQSVGGRTEVVSALPSLLGSLGLLLLIFSLGESLMDRGTAILAGALFAVLPLDVLYGTRILPETLQAFWIALSVLLAWRSRPVASGLALFAGYLTRAQAVLGLPFVILAGLRKGRVQLAPAVAILVFALSYAAEAAYYHHGTGHFFLSARVQKATVRALFTSKPEALFRPLPGVVVHSSYTFGGPHHLFKQMLGRVPHYPGVHLFSLFAPLGGIAIAYALFRRKHALLLAWLVGFFLFVQYGFADLDWDRTSGVLHYYLHFPQPRFLESAAPPLVLLVAALLMALPRRLRAVAVSAVLGVSLYHAYGNYHFYRESLEDMRAVSGFLQSRTDSRVLVDAWGATEIRFFGRGRITKLEPYPASMEVPEGTLVLLGGSRGFDLASKSLDDALPPVWRNLHLHPETAPRNWRPILTRAGPHHVARASDVVLFEVGPP